MNIETQLLNALRAEQARFATEALRKPQNRDAFEYGHRVGVLDGLERAVNVLLTLLDEEKNGDNDL